LGELQHDQRKLGHVGLQHFDVLVVAQDHTDGLVLGVILAGPLLARGMPLAQRQQAVGLDRRVRHRAVLAANRAPLIVLGIDELHVVLSLSCLRRQRAQAALAESLAVVRRTALAAVLKGSRPTRLTVSMNFSLAARWPL